jgi:two-component system sensor histidine kinase/response regulator
MVVDDDPASLGLLEEALGQKDYEVRSFLRGRLALSSASHKPPDLILLDATMPDLTGYEVCERLKADAKLSSIPVIFLTGLRETEDKVRAFRAGGVDHITKPFQLEEIYARVETHLGLHLLRHALQLQNEHLEETVASRTRELSEAHERLTVLDRAKNDFLSVISHELRTPLNGLLGVGEIVFDELSHSEESGQLRRVFEHSRNRIVSLLDDALLLTQIDVARPKLKSDSVSLSQVLNRAVERTKEFAESRHVALRSSSLDLGRIPGGEDLLVRGFQALLETAVRFSEKGGTVFLRREDFFGQLRLFIDSEGRTLPQAAMGKFFDVFSIAEADTPGGELGLGPPLAHRILSLFGADVSVANRDDPAGIRLAVSF